MPQLQELPEAPTTAPVQSQSEVLQGGPQTEMITRKDDPFDPEVRKRSVKSAQPFRVADATGPGAVDLAGVAERIAVLDAKEGDVVLYTRGEGEAQARTERISRVLIKLLQDKVGKVPLVILPPNAAISYLNPPKDSTVLVKLLPDVSTQGAQEALAAMRTILSHRTDLKVDLLPPEVADVGAMAEGDEPAEEAPTEDAPVEETAPEAPAEVETQNPEEPADEPTAPEAPAEETEGDAEPTDEPAEAPAEAPATEEESTEETPATADAPTTTPAEEAPAPEAPAEEVPSGEEDTVAGSSD